MRHEEYTLLCETCGYVVDGLPADGPCPECGRSVRSSQPESRRGTAWQRKRSLTTWAVTGVTVLTRPRRTFSACSIETTWSSDLLKINLWVAGVVLGIVPSIAIVQMMQRSVPPAMRDDSLLEIGVVTVPGMALFGLLFYLLLGLLTGTERVGLRVIGRAHRWRVTPAIALAVSAHASYGWIVGAVLTTTVSLLVVFVPEITWIKFIGSAANWRWSFIPVAALLGLLIFETLVYIGVRRCKFANRARGGTPDRDGMTRLGGSELSAAESRPPSPVAQSGDILSPLQSQRGEGA